MKPKKIVMSVLLLLVSSILPVCLLFRDERLWVSITVLVSLLSALTYLLATQNHSLLFAVVIIANHVIYFPGAGLSRLIIIFTLFFALFLFGMAEKPANSKLFFTTVSMTIVYILFLVVTKPRIIRGEWYILYFEAALFFLFTQLVQWNLEKIKQVAFLYVLVIMVYGLLEYLITGATRIAGPMQSATAFGVILVISWATWISMEIFSKKPDLILAFAVTVPVIFVMFRTGTRMGFVGLVFACLLIIILKVNTSSKTFLTKTALISTMLSLLFLLLVTGWALLPDDLIIKAGFEPMIKGKIDASNMGRILAWGVALKAFQANPLLGIGNGNFPDFMKEYFLEKNITASAPNIFILPHAHNIPLTILSENGIVGFMIATIVLIICLYSIIRKLRDSKDNRIYGLLTGLCVMLFLGMFDAIPYFPSTQVWGAWFLAVMIQFKTDNSKQEIEACT